jgi:hypothetical protein
VIAVRAEADHAALGPLPPVPYQVTDQFLHRVGKDCLVSFESSRYSLPASEVSAGMTVELRVGADTVAVHAFGADPKLLWRHRRARHCGDEQIDPACRNALPDGHTSTTTLTDPPAASPAPPAAELEPVSALLNRPGMGVPVAHRDPRVYDQAAGLRQHTGGRQLPVR